MCKLEKIDGEIQNGQSRDTDNMGTRHRTETKKKYNTED
jgi:hypothetical protein